MSASFELISIIWIYIWIALIVFFSELHASYFEEEKKPSYYQAAVGEAVVFNCHIEFPHDVPIPYILNWNKEGHTIFSSYQSTLFAKTSYQGRIKLLTSNSDYGKGSINLTNIRETDEGWYECQVLYPNRSPITHHNGSWFHLKIKDNNVIAIPPINQTTIEGEMARFSCFVKVNSSNLIWKKDGVRLSNRNHNFPVRYTLDSEGTLSISPTLMDDSGEFTCEATSVKGKKQSASAFLNVQYKAKVVDAPKEIYLPHGRSAVIDCHFRSNPPLVKLRWEKDGFLFDPYNVQGVVYKSNGSLFFDEVKEEHSGSYICTPYNELGTEGPSPKMDVIVLKQPMFTVTPQILYIRRKGETLHIPCDAVEEHGIHKPNILWLKDGQLLPKKGNLTLISLKEEDRGIYRCIASNAVDSIFVETEVMIENTAPRAPYQVEADSTKNSVTVKWKSGLTKPKLKFSVWHRNLNSTIWKSTKAMAPEVKEFTIENLNPGTEYEIMVLSQDMFGEGMFSKSITIKTKGEPKYLEYFNHVRMNHRNGFGLSNCYELNNSIGPPQNVNIEIKSEGWLITWDPPSSGIVDHYLIEWKEVSAMTKDSFYLVKNFNLDETNRFSLFAVNKDQVQSASSLFVLHISMERSIKWVILGVILGTVLLAAAFFILSLFYKYFTL